MTWLISGIVFIVVGFVLPFIVYLTWYQSLQRTELLALVPAALAYCSAVAAACITAATARLQMTAQNDLEKLKAKLGALTAVEVQAYKALWGAAVQYYRALESAEEGNYNITLVRRAAEACNDAESQAFLITKSDDDIFQSYVQMATAISESMAPPVNEEERRRIWEKETKPLATKLDELRSNFAAAVRAQS